MQALASIAQQHEDDERAGYMRTRTLMRYGRMVQRRRTASTMLPFVLWYWPFDLVGSLLDDMVDKGVRTRLTMGAREKTGRLVLRTPPPFILTDDAVTTASGSAGTGTT